MTTAHEFALAMGWDATNIQATAANGVSEADRETLESTDLTADELLAWCKGQAGQQIHISMDGVWAGSGKLRDGTIDDCGAQFCDDNDASLKVYDLIESAIANGQEEIKVELDGDMHTISWWCN